MRNASMKVLKNLVCCAAFICLMFVLAMPAHAASKADELLQLVNAERAQAGVAPLSMGSSALNAAAQALQKNLPSIIPTTAPMAAASSPSCRSTVWTMFL